MSEGSGEDGQEVLGSLPKRRPSIETPRRARQRDRAAKSVPPSEPESSSSSRSELAELERLAGAGVRLTGAAAAAGIKLAGRAAGGLGRIVGR